MAGRPWKLTNETVLMIKEMLWDGATQAQVAQAAGVTSPMISHIAMGRQRADVPWPDGSLGPMPPDRRRSAEAAANQARIAAALTKQRHHNMAQQLAPRVEREIAALNTEKEPGIADWTDTYKAQAIQDEKDGLLRDGDPDLDRRLAEHRELRAQKKRQEEEAKQAEIDQKAMDEPIKPQPRKHRKPIAK